MSERVSPVDRVDWDSPTLNMGQIGDPAMDVQTEAEAEAFVDAYVRLLTGKGLNEGNAREIVRENIGFYTGYYDAETAERVLRLFKAAHPIFGTTRPSPEAAFRAGREMGGQDE